MDADGNLILVTGASADIDLGTGNIAPVGASADPGLVVAKLNTAGQPIWVRRYAAAGLAPQVAVDGTQNVWVAGGLREATDFGGGSIDPAVYGYDAGYLLKLDPNGHHVWSSSGALGLHASADDGILVLGTTPGEPAFITVDPRPPEFGPVGIDSFAAGLGPLGEQLWVRQPSRLNISLPEGGPETRDNLAFWHAFMRPDGSVALFGSVWREYPAGDFTTTSEGYQTLEVVDANGHSINLRPVPDYLRASGHLAESSRGDFVSGGEFIGSGEFGGTPLTSTPSRPVFNGPPLGDLYLAKFDASLNHVWSRSFGSAGAEGLSALVLDESSNIVITGSFDDSLSFGGDALFAIPGTIQGQPAADVFVAKFDASGNHLCSRSFGDSDHQLGGAIALDREGNSFVLGHALATSLSDNRMFLKKLAP